MQSKALLDQIHAALQAYYHHKQVTSGRQGDARSLMESSLYKTVFCTINSRLSAKGARAVGGADTLARTAEDTLSEEEMNKLCMMLYESSDPSAAKYLSLFNFLRSVVGRFDDASLIYLTDLCSPTVVKCIGELIRCKCCCEGFAVECVLFSCTVLHLRMFWTGNAASFDLMLTEQLLSYM